MAALLILNVVALVVLAYRAAAGYYALLPGTAPSITLSSSCRLTSSGQLVLPDGTPCARLDVPAGRGTEVDGALFMVDVLVGPATPTEWFESKLKLLNFFHQGAALVPNAEILGTTPSDQLTCQDDQMMADSSASAEIVALQRLGYSVRQNNLGAQLDQVQPGSPAAAAGLQCNDVVVGIDGKSVDTAQDLVNDIHGLKPGQAARITVQRIGSKGQPTNVTVTARLSGTPVEGSQAAIPSRAYLGVALETRTTFSFPFNVTVNVGDIGGPSAGLALTLGLLDVLSGGQLTGGHRVAATGTISLNGAVGDVGGVAQKTVAVRKAGAQIFFVPPQELAAARSQAGSMKIYAVSTLEQALNILKSLGGRIPTPNASHNGGE